MWFGVSVLLNWRLSGLWNSRLYRNLVFCTTHDIIFSTPLAVRAFLFWKSSLPRLYFCTWPPASSPFRIDRPSDHRVVSLSVDRVTQML